MKKNLIFVILFLIGCTSSFWVGSQHGQRQNWLLYSGVEASRILTRLTTVPFDDSDTLKPHDKDALEAELDELIIRYGGYISNGHKFYHGKINKSKSIHSFFEDPIKYRLENPRMAYSLEEKDRYIKHYEAEYKKALESGEPGYHSENRERYINNVNFMYAALERYSN